MITSRPPVSGGPRRASRWAIAGWLGLVLAPPVAHADDWGGLATISATMGVNDGRLCIGEGSRNDIGCPGYAPYVSRTSGFVGFGTNSPNAELDILGTVSASAANIAGAININTSGPTKWAIIKRSETYSSSQPNNLVFSFNNGAVWTQTLDLTSTGQMGVGVSQPSTSLQVRGSMRISAEVSTTLQTCDASRTGAIKYQSGDFHYCRNGTSWESLSSLTSGGIAGDRITSGTTSFVTYNNTSATLSTAGVERVIIGTNGSVGIGQQPYLGVALSVSGATRIGNQGAYATYNVIADPSATTLDIGTTSLLNSTANASIRFFRATNTTGAVGFSVLRGNGTPNHNVYLSGNGNSLLNIETGNVGVGMTAPNAKLDVAGTVSATTLQLADNPANPCNAANKGMAKVVDGRIYICRYP